MKKLIFCVFTGIWALISFTACSRQNSVKAPAEPVIQKVEITAIGNPPAAAAAFDAQQALTAPAILNAVTPAASPMLSARVTVKKSAIFGRAFLYSLSLQAASPNRKKEDDISHTASEDLQPANFRRLDGILQLVLDEKYKFESDTVHPEQLAQSFAIVAETAETLTIEVKQASSRAAKFLDAEQLDKPARSSWIRSAEASPDGQLLLFETAIETADGRMAEFMEAIFPRENLVPAGEAPIFNDPEHNPLATRFQFLSSTRKKIWIDHPTEGRIKTKIASRFRLPEGKTLDWHILPNVPSELLSAFKYGVEGWNRYSQLMWKRDIVRFKGVLPPGIKLGDPRYNVIRYNADSKESDAWASTAADPTSGIQSHSVINIPKGRILNAQRSWKGAYGAKFKNNRAFAGSVREHENPSDPGPAPGTSPEDFSQRSIKYTIMHEVGHALGLRHNFKASLAHDPLDPKSPVTHSVMDYLNKEYRILAFSDLLSSNGPIMEYDRQILSVLYNGGKDLKTEDLIIASCSNDSPKNVVGLDPFCVGYDTGKDPTQTLWLAIDLLRAENATLSYTRSFASSLKDLATRFGEFPLDHLHFYRQLISVNSIFSYHANLIGRSIGNSGKWLYQFNHHAGLRDTEEQGARERALRGIRYAFSQKKLEPGTLEALEKFKLAYLDWWSDQDEIRNLDQAEKSRRIQEIEKDFAEELKDLEIDLQFELGRGVSRGLGFEKKALFFVGNIGSEAVDLELEVLKNLRALILSSHENPSLTSVRERAAEVLQKYIRSPTAKATVEQTAVELIQQAREAKSTEARQKILDIYKKLTKPLEPEPTEDEEEE